MYVCSAASCPAIRPCRSAGSSGVINNSLGSQLLDVSVIQSTQRRIVTPGPGPAGPASSSSARPAWPRWRNAAKRPLSDWIVPRPRPPCDIPLGGLSRFVFGTSYEAPPTSSYEGPSWQRPGEKTDRLVLRKRPCRLADLLLYLVHLVSRLRAKETSALSAAT